MTPEDGRTDSRVELYWLPLGAGGRSVRWNGRVYETLAANVAARKVCSTQHSS